MASPRMANGIVPNHIRAMTAAHRPADREMPCWSQAATPMIDTGGIAVRLDRKALATITRDGGNGVARSCWSHPVARSADTLPPTVSTAITAP